MEFIALVTELACTGGQSSEGRVSEPDVQYNEDAVVVTFSVRSLVQGAAACPSNPATAIRVTLDEPLGDRMLLDGAHAPPLQPPVCPDPRACPISAP
jgi:hypothetical protein